MRLLRIQRNHLPMRNFKTEGIVIKRRDFKDADRIITILTRDQGKIAVRASGIRRIPSRRSPHVELLNHCTISLYQGRAFPILTEAQTIDSYSPLKTDLQKIGLAYHLCELVDGLCPENQENNAAFLLLKNALSRLSTAVSEEVSVVIHTFEVELLTILGYWNRTEALAEQIDLDRFIENVMERKLRTKQIFASL